MVLSSTNCRTPIEMDVLFSCMLHECSTSQMAITAGFQSENATFRTPQTLHPAESLYVTKVEGWRSWVAGDIKCSFR